MASAQGNGVVLVTQYIPAVNAQPFQQNTPIGQNDRWMQKFAKGEPKSLGVVQILIGIIHICLGGTLCSSPYVFSVVSSGALFLPALFYVITGCLSIAAERKGIRCLVKGALGMNIVSTVAALISSVIYLINLSGLISYPRGCSSSNYYCYRLFYTSQALLRGVLAVLLILSLLACGISISTFTFGFKSICTDSSAEAGQAVFVAQNVYQQDPRFQPLQTASGVPVTVGMPLLGPSMTMAQGTPTMQGMPPPTAYNGKMVPGNPPAPTPTAETTESCYETVTGDTPQI